ncbi:MAG: twin-arginine translocase TatA/TatE family subunit [Fervidicoccaceae archaeon]|uniref:Sec-independent protein translocase protein TatA n=1 Tax=Fervidicoccus fontis TaxID=683846 RepID=A0A7C2UQM2_9CREN|nr:MAG: twin-arginine translocase TatA/TatE family subunit [Fervidicoccus sp.]HEU97605.1 twin-arginine translocase TatA/TatE family subunit [Fervidicoccus fontis]
MPGSLGTPEIVAILIIALLLLGPSKLPQLARSIGEALREFRKAASGATEEEKKTVSILANKQSLTESDRQILLEIAKKLGIETNGLSDSDILKKIQDKVGK